MRLLDVFSGAGGCSVGYARAGFEVTGVDNKPHPDYPFELIVADALDVLADVALLDQFDAVAASPPCPAYSTITPDQSKHPRLIAPVRELLRNWGGPYVIENVPGAARSLINPVKVCGSAFGLAVRRHRFFESNEWLIPTECYHEVQGTPVGVYGKHPEVRNYLRPGDGTRRGDRAKSVEHAQAALGIDWMTDWDDLTDAIPPAYTEFLGSQLLSALQHQEARLSV